MDAASYAQDLLSVASSLSGRPAGKAIAVVQSTELREPLTRILARDTRRTALSLLRFFCILSASVMVQGSAAGAVVLQRLKDATESKTFSFDLDHGHSLSLVGVSSIEFYDRQGNKLSGSVTFSTDFAEPSISLDRDPQLGLSWISIKLQPYEFIRLPDVSLKP